MTNLVFIRPNNPDSLVVIPPLNIGYLSAAARRGYKYLEDVVLVDALRDNLTPEHVFERIPRGSLVAISIMTSDYPWVRKFASRPNRYFTLILGGIHPTLMPAEVLKETNANFVVTGEGEDVMKMLLHADRNNWVEHQILEGGQIQDIDNFPDWDLIDPRTYPHMPWGVATKNAMVAPIITSRGCPYQCTFCASPKLSQRRIRYRSADSVVNELLYLNTYFGVKEFNFQDDNFTANRNRAAEICESILSSGLKIDWACENGIRADKVDKHLLALMKKAGCYKVNFGIESANNQILKNIKKMETIEDIEKGIDLATDAGIEVRASFILGLPGETKETLENTIKWTANSRLVGAQFNILEIMPGSEMWDTMEHNENWSHAAFRTPYFIPEGLTAKDLLDAQQKAFWKFYMKPSRFLNTLKRIKPKQIKSMIKRLFSYNIL
jgi:anaerobic magnesium-protoporphyrin IX monomethyl ester cyclase